MSGITLEAGVFCVLCASCGERVPTNPLAAQPIVESGAVPSQRPKNPFMPPKDTCPKCIAPRFSTANSCRKCGVVFKSFSPEGVAPSKALARGWSDLALRWSDSLQHERFQELAVQTGELTAALRLYSIWLAHLPKDPWGLKGKAELDLLCTIASASRESYRPPWFTARLMVGVATLAVLGGILVAGL